MIIGVSAGTRKVTNAYIRFLSSKNRTRRKKISKTQTAPTGHGAGPQGRLLFALIPFDRLEKRSDALT